jgi:ubiquinol-cytochrome c reductase cytochrome c1 subunit
MKKLLSGLLAFGFVLAALPALASEGEAPPHQKWPHEGITGTYDRAALQRGFQVYKEVCASCHAMKFLSYRDLAGLGYNPDEIKAIAAEYTVTDGPNEEGEMFERPARPSDRFKSPFVNDNAARAANGGALPPDLSLISKARPHGDDYIYALLNGYEAPPAGVELMSGMHYNKYFPGHQIAMPPPLTDGQVAFGDGAKNSVADMAHDVTQFLAWASEPHMEERKQTGIKVVLFLLIFAGIMYAAKRKVWKDVH